MYGDTPPVELRGKKRQRRLGRRERASERSPRFASGNFTFLCSLAPFSTDESSIAGMAKQCRRRCRNSVFDLAIKTTTARGGHEGQGRIRLRQLRLVFLAANGTSIVQLNYHHLPPSPRPVLAPSRSLLRAQRRGHSARSEDLEEMYLTIATPCPPMSKVASRGEKRRMNGPIIAAGREKRVSCVKGAKHVAILICPSLIERNLQSEI